MFYTDIQTLRGLDRPVDYGSGIEYANGIMDSLFPDQHVGLQIGLWLNGTRGVRDILSGVLDENVDKLVEYLATTKATKVFLRVGYEFDNPSFGYSDDPAAYKAAFQHLVRQCRQRPLCYGKVEFVWHSWAAGRHGTLLDFYPGDDFVDWVGVSIFNQFFPWAVGLGELADVIEVLEFAQEHDKPSMIAESTPFGGIELDPALTEDYNTGYNLTDPWDRWFQPTLDLIEEYDIGMWSYINCDWELQPMWHNVGFGETSLSTNKNVMKKWHDLILHGDRPFLGAGSLVTCGRSAPVLGNQMAVMAMQNPTSSRMVPDAAMWLVVIAGAAVCSYVWRQQRQIPRELGEQQTTQELMHMIRYGTV
jgi:hypothetical protein